MLWAKAVLWYVLVMGGLGLVIRLIYITINDYPRREKKHMGHDVGTCLEIFFVMVVCVIALYTL